MNAGQRFECLAKLNIIQKPFWTNMSIFIKQRLIFAGEYAPKTVKIGFKPIKLLTSYKKETGHYCAVWLTRFEPLLNHDDAISRKKSVCNN